MLSARSSLFKQFGALKDLPGEALDELARACSWNSASAGKQIILANEKSNDVYFIASGQVRVVLYSATEGRPVLFTTLGPLEMFGEVAAIDGDARSATVEAEKDCVFAVLSADSFRRLCHQFPAFSVAVMTQMARHIRRLSESVYELSTLSVQSRVHAEILRLAVLIGERDNQALISPAPSRPSIASRIGTTDTAISRVMTGLQDLNIVRKEGKNLRILDMGGLRRLVAEARGE